MVSLYFFYVGFVVGRYVWTLSRKETFTTSAEIECKQAEGQDERLSPIPLALSTDGQDADSHTDTKLFACFEWFTKPLTVIFRIITPSVRPIELNEAQYSPLRKKYNLDIETSEADHLPPVHVSHPRRYLSCLLRRQGDYDTTIGRHSPMGLCHPLTAGTDQIIGILRASLCRALLCIFTCIVYIGLLASLIVQASSVIVTHLGLSQTTIGATFVSLGTEVFLSPPSSSFMLPDP
jgi:Ca2+/Na+ antiporter